MLNKISMLILDDISVSQCPYVLETAIIFFSHSVTLGYLFKTFSQPSNQEEEQEQEVVDVCISGVRSYIFELLEETCRKCCFLTPPTHSYTPLTHVAASTLSKLDDGQCSLFAETEKGHFLCCNKRKIKMVNRFFQPIFLHVLTVDRRQAHPKKVLKKNAYV